MTPGRIHVLAFVVDLRGGVKIFLKASGSEERCWARQAKISIINLVRYLDESFGRDLLHYELFREDSQQRFR